MNKVEEIEEFHQLTDEEVAEYEKKSGNIVIRVGTNLKLIDKRTGIYLRNLTDFYKVVDCDVDTFKVENGNGKTFDILWWDVSGKNPIILLEKIKY